VPICWSIAFFNSNSITLDCAKVEPTVHFYIVFHHTLAVVVRYAKVVLGTCIALLG